MRRLLGLSLALAVLSALVFTSPARAASTTIEIKYFQFVNQVVEVPHKTNVVWKNIEPLGANHNVVVTHFIPPGGGAPVNKVDVLCKSMKPGDKSCTRNNLAKGTWIYTCTIGPLHEATMHGILRIT